MTITKKMKTLRYRTSLLILGILLLNCSSSDEETIQEIVEEEIVEPLVPEPTDWRSLANKRIDLHRKLGHGLLESAYENALAHDLRENGLNVK